MVKIYIKRHNCTKYAHVTFIQFIQVPMIDKRPKCHNSNISIFRLIWINKIVSLKPWQGKLTLRKYVVQKMVKYVKKMGQNYLIPVHYFVIEIITNISIGTCKYDMYNCLPLERCKELPDNEFFVIHCNGWTTKKLWKIKTVAKVTRKKTTTKV